MTDEIQKSLFNNDCLEKKRIEAIFIANEILQEKVRILEGLEKLVPLLFDLRIQEEDDFFTLIAVDSEGDRFPVEKTRKYWNPEKFAELEAGRIAEEEFYKKGVFESCEKLIERLSTPKFV